jgi:hypothetical protein
MKSGEELAGFQGSIVVLDGGVFNLPTQRFCRRGRQLVRAGVKEASKIACCHASAPRLSG